MTTRAKYITLALSAVGAWLAMALVGLIAYLLGPALGFVAGGYVLVGVIARDIFSPAHDEESAE
jgi:hypothetical protein